MEKILLLSFGLCFSTVLLHSSEYQDSIHLNQKFEFIQDTCKASSLVLEYQWLVEKGHYQLAIPYLEEAQLLYKKHQLWEKYVDAFIELSVLSDYLDNETKANYAHQAMVNAQRYLDNEHVLLGLAYRQKGEAYSLLEKDDSSCYYINLAIPILSQASRWEDVAMSKLQLVVNYYYLGDYAKGRAQLEDVFWEEHSFNDDVLGSLYDLQGVYYAEDGDLNKAIRTTQNALQLSLSLKNKNAIDSLHIANHLNNLGDAHNIKGDRQRALDYFRQALHAFPQKNIDFKTYITIENNIGTILLIQEKYQEAIRLFKRLEYQIMESSKPQAYLGSLEDIFYHLGLSYASIGQLDSAHFYLKKTLNIPNSKKQTTPNLGLGYLYLQLEKSEKALQYLGQALADSIYLKENAKIQLSRIYHRMGDAYVLQKQYRQALSYYQKSLVENAFLFPNSVDIYSNPSLKGKVHEQIFFLDALQAKAQTLARFSDKKKDLRASLETYQLAIQFTDSLRQDYILEDNELFWGERYKEIYSEAIHTAYRLFELEKDVDYLELAFSLAEKSKANLLLEALKTNTGQENAGVPSAMIQQERDLSIDLAFYEKSLAEAVEQEDSAKIALYQNYLTSSRLELAQLKEAIERDYPKFHALKYSKSEVDPAKIQQTLLDEQTAILEYFIGPEYAYVFMLSQIGLQVIPLPKTETLHQHIATFKQNLFLTEDFQNNPKKSRTQFNQTAFQLYQDILAKALSDLSPRVNRLIIIPDGALTTLPFEVLNRELEQTPGTNFGQLPYLLKDFQIHYGYSINLLLKNQERQTQLSANNRCLAFAPPYQNPQPIAQSDVRSNQLRNGITALKGTAAEVQAISTYFNGSFDTTASATKASFLEQVDQYGLLHLAMHGEADFDNTKFGHLIFTNKNTIDHPDDHLLFHYEIANLQLQAQLAVLSACETGVGKYEAGEGVFSLARSFMYAGVPSVVMSLWKVNDQSTSHLMPTFYQQMAKGKTKDEALQQAKLRYLEEASLEYRHPFYWSGFVAMGDAQPLKQPRPVLPYLGFGLLFLIAGVGVWWYKHPAYGTRASSIFSADLK